MKTLAIVPARGGSKGIVRKNTREFRGVPLIGHAVNVGLETCDRTIVTTDDVATACLAAGYGVRVLGRPPELARDDTPMLPVLEHVLQNLDSSEAYDALVLLQPSSPSRRRAVYVREAIRMLDEEHADSVVSVVPIPPQFSPDYAVRIRDGELELWKTSEMNHGRTRRQDCEPAFYRDGTVYAIRTQTIVDGILYGDRCVPLLVNRADSVTLDTEKDWTLAEARA